VPSSSIIAVLSTAMKSRFNHILSVPRSYIYEAESVAAARLNQPAHCMPPRIVCDTNATLGYHVHDLNMACRCNGSELDRSRSRQLQSDFCNIIGLGPKMQWQGAFGGADISPGTWENGLPMTRGIQSMVSFNTHHS
jgi:hypothetical protein